MDPEAEQVLEEILDQVSDSIPEQVIIESDPTLPATVSSPAVTLISQPFLNLVSASKCDSKSRLYRQVNLVIDHLYNGLIADYKWAVESKQPSGIFKSLEDLFTSNLLPNVEKSINDAVNHLSSLLPTSVTKGQNSVCLI